MPKYATLVVLAIVCAASSGCVHRSGRGGFVGHPGWQSAPAAAGAPMESARVRIVDFGHDYIRPGDGQPRHHFHYQRYQLRQDAATGLYSPTPDYVKQAHDFDVNGNGRTDDDVVAFMEYSLTKPYSPQSPWYDRLAGSPRWYGGATIYHANKKESGFSENGVNQLHDGPLHYPRDNWALFHENYELNSPYRMYGLWVWQKHDFLNGGTDFKVSFDDKTELALYLQRYFMGVEGVRFVIRDGKQFYVSEQVFKGAGQHPGSGDGKQHILCPNNTKWAKYNPKAPYTIDFDPKTADFKTHNFKDVTAAGWYMFKDRLMPSYVGFKWYAFEVDAVVHRRKRPSENTQMVEIVPEEKDIPNFYISTTEVPYELWKNVFRLGRSNTFVRDPRGFIFDKDGDMGSMKVPGPDGKLLAHSPDEPVTDITMHDAAAWCNALSVQESREPCYYEDPALKTVFRFVTQSPAYGKPRPLPNLYVKWAADGYRLPTPAEWQTAAIGSVRHTETATQTRSVGTHSRFGTRLQNMLGNVWELAWDFGEVFKAAETTPITALGGGFLGADIPDDPAAYRGSPHIGFRLVRREPGGNRPGKQPIATGTPSWRITLEQHAQPASQKITPPKLDMVAIPKKPFVIARSETSYATWLAVYNWAVADGYEFDHDGDMGSMDYWGFRWDYTGEYQREWRTNAGHLPAEPVTDITAYDAQVWCNALSAMEGRTPVYYSDKACTKVYKKAFRHRPLMKLFFEVKERIPRSLASEVVYVKKDADGYRLPTIVEFNSVAGPALVNNRPVGWFFDVSGLGTRPVTAGTPNEHGLLNMRGNVSEIAEGGRVDQATRLGGSFLDLAVAGGKPLTYPRGWGYPDIGFRVVRKGGK
jgi:formylglycine-generating enzyme required for sulfatase activity